MGNNPDCHQENSWPSDFSVDEYSFAKYETKQRFLTYWQQLDAILALAPESVLEIGVGTGLVSSYLRYKGVEVTTIDINASLEPDVVGSVLDLESYFQPGQFDLVLCSRVLHHLPFESFERSVQQIAHAAREHAIISLPIDDFSFYFMFRYTSSSIRTIHLRLPLVLKRLLLRRRYRASATRHHSLWKIGDSKNRSLGVVQEVVNRSFRIRWGRSVPEDRAHYLMSLEKRPRHGG